MNNVRAFPLLPTPIAFYAAEQPDEPWLIEPAYILSGTSAHNMKPFVICVEKMLHVLLDGDILDALIQQRSDAHVKKTINYLSKQLPVLQITYPPAIPGSVSVITLAEFTAEVARLLSDTFSNWLALGKILNIPCQQSLNFHFVSHPQQKFFFHQIFLDLHDEQQLQMIKDNWEALKNQIRLNILIYNGLKPFIFLFDQKFIAVHQMHYISKLLSYQYRFCKTLQKALLKAPHDRHVSIKILKTQLVSCMKSAGKRVLGIFGAMNILRENEVFEEGHLLQAVRECLSYVDKVENSFILDRTGHAPILIFYIEIEKKDGSAFTLEEVRVLKNSLACEIKESVQSVIHPMFMPRNEEEIMRNTLLLSQQLKFFSDLPQVIISFDEQEEKELIFRVILLRILKNNTESLLDIFAASSELSIRDLEIRHVGTFRKKHIKEANVLKVAINKKKFLRKDFSIDLFKARQTLSSELDRIFKGIRDFNGGILSKQQEALLQLRSLLKGSVVYKVFLLENFFYSLTPPL